MRVLVALDNRFLKTQNGNIYSTTVCDYGFWRRYLQVFDEVVVLARVADISEEKLEKSPANGPNVSFFPLPYFIGPRGYLKQYRRLKSLVKQSLAAADVFILRTPSTIANTLWHYLKTKRIPYGVEVVGDPWESLMPGTVKSLLRPVARYILTRKQKEQCQRAVAATYVTQYYLQRLYPPGGWSTNWSDVNLPDNAIVDEERFAERLECFRSAADGQRPFRICHMGTMSVLYKGQDVLIGAVSSCRKKGRDIKLTLLGEGQYYQYYLDKAKKLGLEKHVKFLGQLPPGQAVINQLDAADLFVLPSLTEGMPRSLIEAMARGLPCLASKVGGIPELLADEDLFPSGNVTILAEKIDSLFTDRRKIGEMARRNLQTAKKYRSDELNQRRRALYQRLKEKTEEWYAKGGQK